LDVLALLEGMDGVAETDAEIDGRDTSACGTSATSVRSLGRAGRYALSGVAWGVRRRGIATVVFDNEGSAGTDADATSDRGAVIDVMFV
jgi:hypothetical protein